MRDWDHLEEYSFAILKADTEYVHKIARFQAMQIVSLQVQRMPWIILFLEDFFQVFIHINKDTHSMFSLREMYPLCAYTIIPSKYPVEHVGKWHFCPCGYECNSESSLFTCVKLVQSYIRASLKPRPRCLFECVSYHIIYIWLVLGKHTLARYVHPALDRWVAIWVLFDSWTKD